MLSTGVTVIYAVCYSSILTPCSENIGSVIIHFLILEILVTCQKFGHFSHF